MHYSKNLLAILLVAIIATNSVAGFFVFAPQAEAQGLQLRVSAAERSEFENHFFGAQVVQIIIEDPGATDPDESTVGLVVLGVTTPRVHLADGLWYSFIAEEDSFGLLLDVLTDGVTDNAISIQEATVDSSDPLTVGVRSFDIVPGDLDSFVREISVVGTAKFVEIDQSDFFPTLPQPFFETAGTINPDASLADAGDIADIPDGLCDSDEFNEPDTDCDWPYIRLFGIEELDQVPIRAGSASVDLIFDDFADSIKSSIDRKTNYPLNAEVIVQYTDFMWNINPVEEDVVRFVFDRHSGVVTNIIYEPIRNFDPDGAGFTGENFADFFPVLTSSPGMEFDERQILELDPEGVSVLAFINFFDPDNGIIGQFAESPFTFDATNARRIVNFGAPIFIRGTTTPFPLALDGDERPVITMIENDPNTSFFESIDEQEGGRSVIFTGFKDRVANFDYFDIIASAPMRTHDGFTSVDREFYDSADRAVFTVTDPDQNLRSRISEEPTGRDAKNILNVGKPFPLINTRQTNIFDTNLDRVLQVWEAVFLLATSDTDTFGAVGGDGANVLADINNDPTIDVDTAAGLERFHVAADDIEPVASLPVNNDKFTLVFTTDGIGLDNSNAIIIDTNVKVDDIDDVVKLTGVTLEQIQNQVRIDNLADGTPFTDQAENFLVQVGRITAANGAIVGRTADLNTATGPFTVEMPKYNLINLDLTALGTTGPINKVVVKIDAIDSACSGATTPALAFDELCVNASQIVDFQIVESNNDDADGIRATGDAYDVISLTGVNNAGAPWDTLTGSANTGYDRDVLSGGQRTSVGAFRILDLIADPDVSVNDRIRITILLIDAAGEPAEIISQKSHTILVDIIGLGIIFDKAPTNTNPDQIESKLGNTFSNVAYRLELDEEGSNSSVFTGRADFMTFIQFDTVGDVLNEIVLTGDPLKIWLPNRFIPPNRLAFTYFDDDIVNFFRQVSATFIYETRDGMIEWDSDSYKFGDRATITLVDEDLNRRPDARERYNLPLDAFLFFELGKVRVDTDCTVGTSNCFINQVDATFLETGADTGIFIAQIEMPQNILLDDSITSLTSQKDLEVNYIDVRDRSSIRQEFDDITNTRTNLGQIILDRSAYPPGPSFVPGTLLDPTPKIRLVGPIMYIDIIDQDFNLDPDRRDVLDLTQFVNFTSVSGKKPDFRDIVTINIFDGGGSKPVKFSNSVSNILAPQVIGSALGLTPQQFISQFGSTADAFPILDRSFNSVTKALESGPNTGIFELEFQIYCPDVIPDLAPFLSAPICTNKIFQVPVFNSNSPIEVTYNDPDDGSGTPEDVEAIASIQTQTAIIGSDKPAYNLGEEAILLIIEPDFNMDSREIEFLDFNFIGIITDKTPVDELPLGLLLQALAALGEFTTTEPGFRELEPNAGIFGAIVEEGAVDETVVSRGEKIELIYRDQTPSGGGEEIRVEYEVLVLETKPEIIFDKEEYTPFDEVTVRIISPDSNDEPLQIQSIRVLVSTSSTGGFLLNVPETGPNTGIFEEDFDLTPNPDLFPGDLVAIREDGLSAEFRIDEDTVVTKSVFINYHIGNVMFDRDWYATTDRAVVRVIDPDENKNPDTIDTLDLRIWSTSDRGGLLVTLRETGDRTGIFEEFITFTTDEESTGTRLRASNGDTITVKYTDRTLPAPAALASDGVFTVEVEEIFSSALIATRGPPIERAPASEPVLVDQDGELVEEISTGQQVLVQSEISNIQKIQQTFAYIVQIKDADDVTVSLSWISGQLAASEKILAAQSWIPSVAGEYTIEVFVWESIDNPVALSPVRSIQVRVS